MDTTLFFDEKSFVISVIFVVAFRAKIPFDTPASRTDSPPARW
jgi:hypothetical protein